MDAGPENLIRLRPYVNPYRKPRRDLAPRQRESLSVNAVLGQQIGQAIPYGPWA
jgi:hypothetical protein